MESNKKINKFLNFSISQFLNFSGIFFIFLFLLSNKTFAKNNSIDIPEILPRSTWFTSDLQGLSDWKPAKDNFPPDYRKIDRIIIHHSGGSNDISNPVATIKNIYRYHTVTKGWNDIGYNYIIDREGRIYEGRQGGNGVRGAHVYARNDCLNFNYGSIGIVFLGDYSTQQPPEAMHQSAVKLIGWLAEVNGLNPAQSARYSMVWQDGRIGRNKCDSSTGGFTHHYYGPTVIGHKDVDNTSCPGVIDLARIRKEAGEYAKQLSIINYQLSSEKNKVYEIKKGQAKLIADDKLSAIKPDNIVEISQSQLDLFMNNDYYKYSDGHLLKFGKETGIYLVDGGKIRAFESADTMKKLGFSADDAIVLAKTDKDLYPQGTKIKYGPDGKLFVVDNTVYYIDNGKKRGITSAVLFESLGFKWNEVAPVSQDKNFGDYLNGDLMRYKDGTLVMSPNSLAVYKMQDGKRQGFTSAEIFENLGYKWDKILKISEDELSLYPYSGEVRYPDGFVLRQEKDLTVYIIENGEKRPFASPEEFLESGKKWEDVIVLKTDELKNYKLAASHLAVAPKKQTQNFEVKDIKNIKKTKETKETDKPNNINSSKNKLASLIAPINNNQETKETKDDSQFNSKSLVPDTVRVALKSFSKNVRITSIGGGYVVKKSNEDIVYKGDEGNVYTIPYSLNVDLTISGAGDEVILKLQAIDSVVIDGRNPFHSGYGGVSDNIFAGSLHIKYSPVSRKCWVINELPLEDYIKGVAEVSEELPAEYLKTMAVIIRTYAVYHISNKDKHPGEPFDLKNSLNGNGDDQIYKGYGFTRRAPIFASMVDATKGQLIVYNKTPILAAFSSDSGGVSKDARKVWGAAFNDKPYLFGGINDPDSTIHNQYLVSISHGAGLSAAGAKEMARIGASCKEIIEHYYPGTEIK